MSYAEESDRHALYLQRLATGLLNSRVYPSLDKAYKAARLIMLDAENIRNLRQLNIILRKVEASTTKITAAALDEVTKELNSIAIYEASYHAALVGGFAGAELSVPGNKTITDFINESLMSLVSGQRSQTGTWAEFLGNQIASTAKVYNETIKASFVNNESVSQGIARMRMATNGLLRNEYEALVRTGLQHYAVQAREAMAQNNLDILEKRYYNAVFDNRTSLLCAGRHGKTWLLTDEDYPQIPAHFNCRSSWLMLLKGQDAPSGTRAAIGGKDTETAAEKFEKREERTDKKVRYRGKRDADIFDPGQIKAGTTYDKWLKSQPDWFIESTLGDKRAKLFKEGGLSMSKFTDMTGRTLTLDELMKIDRAAFEKAGLI